MAAELQERPARRTDDRPLRAVAEKIGPHVPKGFRIEILEGQIIVSPRNTPLHSKTIYGTARQLEDQLPDDLDFVGGLDLAESDDKDNEPVPDVIVVPRKAVQDDLPRIDANAVTMTVEVISRTSSWWDHSIKTGIYARWSIPIYLILDPRDGTALLQHDPDASTETYRASHRLSYGTRIKLPDPLKGVIIDTTRFRTYPERK